MWRLPRVAVANEPFMARSALHAALVAASGGRFEPVIVGANADLGPAIARARPDVALVSSALRAPGIVVVRLLPDGGVVVWDGPRAAAPAYVEGAAGLAELVVRMTYPRTGSGDPSPLTSDPRG